MPSNPSVSPQKIRVFLRTAIIGFCMGCADLVPGVSGGTVAFISGIYDRLIDAVRSVGNAETLRAALRLQYKKVWKAIDGWFLLALGTGILTAVFTLAHTFEALLTQYPEYFWSLFFGLVLASTVVVGRRVRQWNRCRMLLCIGGAFAGYLFAGALPVSTPDSWWFLVLSGAVASMAMILPGVSGSYLLVLLGKYQFILQAVNERNIQVLALVAIGVVIGVLLTSRILGWLLHHRHDATVATLTGLMFGSVRQIWPWKEIMNGYDQTGNVLPCFLVERACEQQDMLIIAFIAVGILFVAFVEWILITKKSRHA